jgi:hypothetical protein
MFGAADDTSAAVPGPHAASDCLGGLLAVADYRSRQDLATGRTPLPLRELLDALVRAQSIQLALQRPVDDGPAGHPRVAAARIATAAVATALLGGSRPQISAAIAHAGAEAGVPARAALGDAAGRGVRLALLALSSGDHGVATPIAAGMQLPGPDAGVPPSVDLPRLLAAFAAAVAARYSPKQAAAIMALFADAAALDVLPVHAFVAALVRN